MVQKQEEEERKQRETNHNKFPIVLISIVSSSIPYNLSSLPTNNNNNNNSVLGTPRRFRNKQWQIVTQIIIMFYVESDEGLNENASAASKKKSECSQELETEYRVWRVHSVHFEHVVYSVLTVNQ